MLDHFNRIILFLALHTTVCLSAQHLQTLSDHCTTYGTFTLSLESVTTTSASSGHHNLSKEIILGKIITALNEETLYGAYIALPPYEEKIKQAFCEKKYREHMLQLAAKALHEHWPEPYQDAINHILVHHYL